MTKPENEGRTPSETMEQALATGQLPAAADMPGLGEGLRALRRALGLRAADAAAQVGVSVQTWQQWEAEQELPSLEELAHLVRTLGPEREFDLWRRWRRTPRRMLGQALDAGRQTVRVARSTHGANDLPSLPEEVLAVRNLEVTVRESLARWCRHQGLPHDEAGLANALRQARTLTRGERDLWIREVSSWLEKDSDAHGE